VAKSTNNIPGAYLRVWKMFNRDQLRMQKPSNPSIASKKRAIRLDLTKEGRVLNGFRREFVEICLA